MPGSFCALRDRLNELLAQYTGKDVATIARDTDRDYYMTPEEAKEYGLIDDILVAARKREQEKVTARSARSRHTLRISLHGRALLGGLCFLL